jgi:hypothetical protein
MSDEEKELKSQLQNFLKEKKMHSNEAIKHKKLATKHEKLASDYMLQANQTVIKLSELNEQRLKAITQADLAAKQ